MSAGALPPGAVHFAEHGLAPDGNVRTWQHRLEPLQKQVAGGCHLTRQPVEVLEKAGFTVTAVDCFYEEGVPKSLGADSLGIATLNHSGR